jgi:hypothetical protein
MFTVTRGLVVVAVAALMAGGAGRRLDAQRRDKNVITAEEIERAQPNVRTAYDAVRMLRPRWLQWHELTRIPGRAGEVQQGSEPHVYLNSHDQGGVDYLRTLAADAVLELHWFDVNEAGGRFGPTDVPAIEVTLKR